MAYPSDERYSDSPRPARPRPELGTARNRPGEGAQARSAARPASRPAGAERPTYNSRPSGVTRPTGAARSAGANRPAATRPPQRPAQRPPEPPHRRSVQPRFFVFLAILLMVVIAIVAAVVMLKKPDASQQAQQGGTPAQTQQTSDTQTGEDVGADSGDSAAIDPAELQKLLASEDEIEALDDSQRINVADLSINENLPDEWMNVLLLGTDEREQAAKGRTDSMIICSVNKNTGEVKLSSIQRDLAVDFADLGYADLGTVRINSANYFGGPEMAMKTVNELFDMNIQHYALINFFGFQDAVNVLGGITMDITEAEMNKINDAQKQVAGIAKNAGIDISGWDNEELTEYGDGVRLNGQQALGYARIRKLDSDFGRSERQRKVLMAMLDEVKTKSALEIAQLGAAMMPYLTTNLDLNEIMNVAMVVLSSNMEIDSAMRLPVNGTFTQERRTLHGTEQDMLWDCDFVQNAQELYNFIYN